MSVRLSTRGPSCRTILTLSLILGSSAMWARADDAGSELTSDAGPHDTLAHSDSRAAQIRDLLAEQLDVEVSPQSLFDVPLDSAEAIEVERARISALLQALETSGARTAPKVRKHAGARESPTWLLDAGVNRSLFADRLELDRARLAFYELTPVRRAALLESHTQRRASADAAQLAASERAGEQQRRASAVDAERQRLLELAQKARSEAERSVSAEVARLRDVERRLLALRERIRMEREELAAGKELVLGWQQRVRSAKAAGESVADITYDSLRTSLRAARGELDRALDTLADASSTLPSIGPDPLGDVPPEISTEAARKARAGVTTLAREVSREQDELRRERAQLLLTQVDLLNRERLGLLAHLSSEKREAITGFTPAGWDQARSELRHLRLILRYHRYSAEQLLATLRETGLSGASLFRLSSVVLPWICVLALVLWWRRRSALIFAFVEERLEESERSEQRSSPSGLRRGLRFLRQVHRPCAWLFLFAATLWLLPDEVLRLLEVQLLSVIVGSSLMAALIVDVINALAMGPQLGSSAKRDRGSGELRQRSLRLVAGVVVAFTVVLLLTARLVGKGTLYSVVFSTCWAAAVPVFLLLVRWWREIVFERLERLRKKSPLDRWILDNRRGWPSFFAAMIAAVQLFVFGAAKTLRSWLSNFDVARHAHAYLFKREVDRLAGQGSQALRPLGPRPYAELSPEGDSDLWIAGSADRACEQLAERVRARQAGIIALVGARGLGKSTILRRLATAHPQAALVGLAPTLDQLTPLLPSPPALVLIDGVGGLVKPVLGGLQPFDALISRARACPDTLWVLAIDAVIWPFLKRARDAQPLFDEVITLQPWTEEQIGELLMRRSERAGVSPTFEALLEKLPKAADELDRQEALQAKRAGYFRMVWDFARGNPGIALEVWRASLVEDERGAVHVRSLQAPNVSTIEGLPDQSLFILRAVLQLAPARTADVARATRLGEAQVDDTLRYGLARGFLVEHDGGVRVAWPWLRAVLLLMERRHLLVKV